VSVYVYVLLCVGVPFAVVCVLVCRCVCAIHDVCFVCHCVCVCGVCCVCGVSVCRLSVCDVCCMCGISVASVWRLCGVSVCVPSFSYLHPFFPEKCHEQDKLQHVPPVG